MTRKTGLWGAARGLALALLAAPLLLSGCQSATTSQKPITFKPAAKAGTYPAWSGPARIVDAKHFVPGAKKKRTPGGDYRLSAGNTRLWNRRAGEAGYIYIGSLKAPTGTKCREKYCGDVKRRLAETAARHGADLLDVREFTYRSRLKTQTSQGKCLKYGGYTTVKKYHCPNIGGASCRYVDRKVRQCLQYETKYGDSNREYSVRGGKVGLWRKEPALAAKKVKRDATRRKAGDAAARRWAANVSRSLRGHFKAVTSVAWSPDGRFLVSGSLDATVRIWDAASGKTVRYLDGGARRCPAYCTGVYAAWSPDGRFIADSWGKKTTRIWDAANGKIVRRFKGGSTWIGRALWSPDGQFLANSSDNTVRIVNARDGRLVRALTGHSSTVSAVAWSPDGRFLASGSNDKTVRIWETANGKLFHRLHGFPYRVTAVAWSPDGRFLVSTSSKKVYVWNATARKMKDRLTGHSNTVDALAWSPDGKTLASGSTFTDHERSDNTLRLWSASGFTPVTGLGWPASGVKALAWSPDGRFLAVGLKSGKIEILKVGARTAAR